MADGGKKHSDMLTTSNLANELGRQRGEVFALLQKNGWIARAGENWELTAVGTARGGTYRTVRGNRYVYWPKSIVDDDLFSEDDSGTPAGAPTVTATGIGEAFKLSSQRINSILSELGWISKDDVKGWILTEQGLRVGGRQVQHPRTGKQFVRWPQSIITYDTLVGSIEEVVGLRPVADQDQQESADTTETPADAKGFRERFQARLRTTDGHFVRSRAEMLIDNWLYMAEIVHAYERKLPIEEEAYCDFYIPAGKVYIEFWGMESDARYCQRQTAKRDLYRKYAFGLIELTDTDVENLDDILPAKLRQFGVQAY